MKLHLLAVALLLSLATAFAGSYTFAGGDGSSFEKAILIQNANQETGVRAEYHYIGKHFPGYAVGQQALVTHEKRTYDVLTLNGPAGAKKIYFDITEFFGKP